MTNKQKIIKTFILLLVFIPSFIFLGGPGYNGGGSGGNSFNWGANVTPSYGSNCDAVQCTYSYAYNKNTDFYIEMKNMYGNTTIAENGIFESNISQEFLAGTFIMLKVYQKQNFYSNAYYQVIAKRQKWICSYYKKIEKNGECLEYHKIQNPSNYGPAYINGPCKTYEKVEDYELVETKEENCGCSGTADKIEYKFKGWFDVTAEHAGDCSSQAIPKSIDIGSLFAAEYRDSNDVDNTAITEVVGHECSVEEGKIEEKTDSEGKINGGNTLSGECNISYDRNAKICINVKNGQIRYLDNNPNGQCNKEEEYEVVPDEDGYWKYFIPLNATSAEDFSFKLKSSGYIEDVEMCQAYKDDYPDDWEKIIKMNSNGTCTLEIEIKIPIEQKFYNETNGGQNFKGFNFYYRPIDINNPFPNGVNESSLWYDWNNNQDKDPDISKSYDKVTYVAKNINAEALRNYNKYEDAAYSGLFRTWYSDWEENMYLDGTSKFIDKEGIVERQDGVSYYKLGCGPANTNVDNIFAQVECDT